MFFHAPKVFHQLNSKVPRSGGAASTTPATQKIRVVSRQAVQCSRLRGKKNVGKKHRKNTCVLWLLYDILPETNSSHLKIADWKRVSFPFWDYLFLHNMFIFFGGATFTKRKPLVFALKKNFERRRRRPSLRFTCRVQRLQMLYISN